MRNLIQMTLLALLTYPPASLAGDSKQTQSEGTAYPEIPQNLVIEPNYIGTAATGPKLQYEVDHEMNPPVQQKEAPAELTSGAEYEKGEELFITPKTNVVFTDEEILDQDDSQQKEKDSNTK